MSKYLGDITHGEKFTNKDGEEKTKWTKVGGLFYDDQKDRYSVKFLGQWLNVFPPKPKEDVAGNPLDLDETFGDSPAPKKPEGKTDETLDIGDLPF